MIISTNGGVYLDSYQLVNETAGRKATLAEELAWVASHLNTPPTVQVVERCKNEIGGVFTSVTLIRRQRGAAVAWNVTYVHGEAKVADLYFDMEDEARRGYDRLARDSGVRP